ncbi:MAG TPA: DUF3472 domain-containing protein [Pirellulales bacterium]|jgi:uncharacterized protein YndB with AHSA1/START domain|nr:DUF3472 domain-containing protein [Pirellulales bacterium]
MRGDFDRLRTGWRGWLWLVACAAGCAAVAQVDAASPAAEQELRVPAFTAYLAPNPDGASVSSKGIRNWTDPKQHVQWFGEFAAPGDVHCQLAVRLPKGAVSKLQLTLEDEQHKVIQRHTAVATGDGASGLVDFGNDPIAKPGYVAFTVEALNEPGKPNGDLNALVLSGSAIRGAHFNLKERRNAASVHLNYPLPADVKGAAFYAEATAVEDPLYTYYEVCGFQRGYFGMQVNGKDERRIIFSVWDSGKEGVDRSKVAAADRVQLVAKGADVVAGDFGHEGTGGHSHLVFPWKTGETQRFVVTAQPVDPQHTIYSGYYFRPDQKKWMLISSWNAPGNGGWLHGLYSFNEDFVGSNGQLRRQARFGNQWLKTDAGKWIELTTATFSHDPTGDKDRLDRFGGITPAGQFFLSNGGFLAGTSKAGEKFVRPATGVSPGELELPPLPEKH